jgi:hypothetical protein
MVPFVPDSVATVTASGATVGGFVSAQHDAEPHSGCPFPRDDFGPVAPLVNA